MQSRIGLNGKTFRLLKFATMLKNSPHIGAGAITVTNDPRVLPIGRFLRHTKINELPQILNILRGDMSIVAAPTNAEAVWIYDDAAREKISSLRPGLTGVWGHLFFEMKNDFSMELIIRRNLPSKDFTAKQMLELWYVDNVSVSLYFKLIALTAVSVMLPDYDASNFLPQKIKKHLNELLG